MSTAFQLPPWVWDVYVTAICASALWKGRTSERLGAAAIFGCWIASVLVARPGWWAAAGAEALVDMVLLVALVAIALRSSRFWPIFAAGFQLLAILTYWAHTLDPTLGGWVYLTANIIWSYLMAGALALGVWNVWQEERQLATSEAPIIDPGATRR